VVGMLLVVVKVMLQILCVSAGGGGGGFFQCAYKKQTMYGSGRMYCDCLWRKEEYMTAAVLDL